MDKEIKIEDNEKYFKSGIGDLDDLKVLDSYDKKHEEDFQIDLTLAGKTLENNTYYPKIEAGYSLKAKGIRKVERTTNPADYNFDVIYQPNFKAYYKLVSYDPVFDLEMDTFEERTSIIKDDGNKSILNLTDDNNKINRKAMTFSHQENLATIERSAFFIHRYSKFRYWSKINNSDIRNGESSVPSLAAPKWSFDQRNGRAAIQNYNYYFTILKPQEGDFDYEDFIIEANVTYRKKSLIILGEKEGFVGFAFNIINNNNFYFAGINNRNDKVVLFKVQNGNKTVLKEVSDPSTNILTIPSGWFGLAGSSENRKIKVKKFEGEIKVYANGRLAISYNDDNPIDGKGFGLSAYRTSNVSFRNITFDRYVIFKNLPMDDFIKYGETKNVLSTDTFNQIFQNDVDGRLLNGNIETSWYSWWKNNKVLEPQRKASAFNNINYNLKTKNYKDTDTHHINTNRSSGQEWVSGWSRDSVENITINFTEYGDHWEKDGGLYHSDEDRWNFKVDYSIYYQPEGSSSWKYFTRRRSTEDTKKYSRKNRTVSINFKNLNKYRIKVVYKNLSNKNSSFLKIRNWKERQDRFNIKNMVFIQEKLFGYTEISNSNFVKGNDSRNYVRKNYKTVRPEASITGYPVLSDYTTCRVEVQDVTPITLSDDYLHYNKPLNYFWSSSGNENTTAETDTLMLNTSFEIRRNLNGSLAEITRITIPSIMEEDSRFLGEEIYPDIESVTIDDDRVASTDDYKILIKLENNLASPEETKVKFEITRELNSTYHKINGSLNNDNVLAFPDPNVIETALFDVLWPETDEEIKESTIEVKAFINGYFADNEQGLFDYSASFSHQGTGFSRQINITSNRGNNISKSILFPEDIAFGTVEIEMALDYAIYQKFSLIDNLQDISEEIVVVGKTDAGYIAKEEVEADLESLNFSFQSSGTEIKDLTSDDVISISSSTLDNGYYLRNWKDTITRSGSVSLLEPVWTENIPEDGYELSSLFAIPEDDIGSYSFIAECKEQLLSPDVVTIKENEQYKAMVKMSGVMNWKPYIHNGYFYITDEKKDSLPEEYYLYSIPQTDEFTDITAGEIYYLSNFPKQLSPLIAVSSDGKNLKRVTFLDENYNLSLLNKEKTKLVTEKTPVEINVKTNENFDVEVIKKENNIIYLSSLKTTPGDSVFVEYLYSGSKVKNDTLVVSENYTITLKEEFVSGVFLKYEDVKPESINIVDSEGNLLNFKDVNKNYIELDILEDKKGEEVIISYMIEDSFTVNNFNSRPEIKFSNSYPLGVKVSYENSEFTSYYKEPEINLNPHINDYNQGFLFISNKKPLIGSMDIAAFPKTIYSDGIQKVYLKISILDNYQNPFYNPDFKDGVTLGCNSGNIEFIDYEGNLQAEIPEKDMSVPDKFGNVYAIYTYSGGEGIEEDLIYAQYGDLTSSQKIRINPKRIKNDLDSSAYTEENEEYHIQINPEKYIIGKGEQIEIKIKTYNKKEKPIVDVPVYVTIRDTFDGSEEEIEYMTDKDGLVSFLFHKTLNHSDLDTYMFDCFAVINGNKISDITSVTVMRTEVLEEETAYEQQAVQ